MEQSVLYSYFDTVWHCRDAVRVAQLQMRVTQLNAEEHRRRLRVRSHLDTFHGDKIRISLLYTCGKRIEETIFLLPR